MCACLLDTKVRSIKKGVNSDSSLGLSSSDTDIEKMLVARLHELEKSASWLDNLCLRTARDLKKHRMKLAKNKIDDEAILPKIRFLNSVHDKSPCVCLKKSATTLPQHMIKEASESTFVFRRGEFNLMYFTCFEAFTCTNSSRRRPTNPYPVDGIQR